MHRNSVNAALISLAVLALSPGPALAQAKYTPPTGSTPRTADGKPDLSGVWQHPFVQDMTKNGANQKGEPTLPYTAWGDANKVEEFDYTAFCLPLGYTRSIN